MKFNFAVIGVLIVNDLLSSALKIPSKRLPRFKIPKLPKFKNVVISSNSGSNFNISQKMNDMVINRSNAVWHCDKITCPIKTTETCKASKVGIPNTNKIERRNFCYDINGKVLQSGKWIETLKSNLQAPINMVMNRNNIITTHTKKKTQMKSKKVV